MRFLMMLPLLISSLHAAESLLTYENRPTGSMAHPLVLRTYLPDPGIEAAVFSQHDRATSAPKYNPEIGQDVKGENKPVPGIAAAIAVNFGDSLSYVYDTTECRLLYVWQGGFVDMTPYWGDVAKGSRVSFDYVPRLIGSMYWKAEGKDPITLDGKSLSDSGVRKYQGYHLENEVPVFEYLAGSVPVKLKIAPGREPFSCQVTVSTTAKGKLGWRGVDSAQGEGTIHFTLNGHELAKFNGYHPDLKITKPTAAVGEKLFAQYGCSACHSIDGSRNHGPSVGKLFGHPVEIEGLEKPIIADRAYLLESIKEPNAKVVKGYPPNYMPPFGLPDVEYQSLVLYIESLGKTD